MPVIPKGDNFGNAQIKAGRTNLQGDNGAVGRAVAGLGRDVMGVGLKLQHEKEQERKSLNRVSMANAALEYQKQVNATLKDIDEKVNSGELQPEEARQKTQESLDKVDISTYTPIGLDEEELASWNLNVKKINYTADLQATGVEEKGIKVKAQTSISQLINNAKESNYTPDQVLQILGSEDVKKSASLGFGIKSQEALDNLGRGYTFDYLHNQTITASDNSNYKALKQIKSNVNNPDYYKGVLQQDDRVKIAHAANMGMKKIESEWKQQQAQLKSDIAYSDQNILAASANGQLIENQYTEKDYINAYGQKAGSRRFKDITTWQNEVAPKILTYNNMTIEEIGQDVDKSKPVVADSKPLYKVSDFEGMIEQGNIDLSNRPIVKNDDGSISTVRSMSIGVDGKEYLIPTVSPDGKILTDDEAIELFNKTKKHLGVFDTPETATAYAEKLHNQQEQFYLEPNIPKTGEGYAARDKVYKFKVAAAQQVINERIKNPFGVAVRMGRFNPISPDSTPDDIGRELSNRVAMQPELIKLGVNAPIISQQESRALTHIIKNSTNTEYQIGLIQQLGKDLPPPVLSQLAAEIAPNDGVLAFSAMLLNTPDVENLSNPKDLDSKEIQAAVDRAFDPKERNKPRPKYYGSTIDKENAAITMLQGSQLLNPTESMKQRGVKPAAIPSENKLRESFNDYVGNAYEYNPQAYLLTFENYKAAYAGLAYRSGNTDSTTDVSSDISKQAALMATGGVYKNIGNTWSDKHNVVMPYGMTDVTFYNKYTAQAKQALKGAGLNYNGLSDLTPVSVGINKYKLAYGKTGRWAVNEKTGEQIILEIK